MNTRKIFIKCDKESSWFALGTCSAWYRRSWYGAKANHGKLRRLHR